MGNAAASKPKPVFTWTLDGKPLTEMETRDEEVMVDADGLSKFSQSLIYTPEVWHANKTLACSIVHPGLPDQLEEEIKKEKAGLASKVTALLTKLRPEKKEEEVKVEEVKEEDEKKDEEKKVEEEKPVRR